MGSLGRTINKGPWQGLEIVKGEKRMEVLEGFCAF